jgi:hypothetical protein
MTGSKDITHCEQLEHYYSIIIIIITIILLHRYHTKYFVLLLRNNEKGIHPQYIISRSNFCMGVWREEGNLERGERGK